MEISDLSKSPCIKLCELEWFPWIRDRICIGCGRLSSDIGSWKMLTDEEKIEVNQRAIKNYKRYLDYLEEV